MKGVARISFQGGGLVLSVKTPYDRETLFEHVDRYTKRYGHVRVELNRRDWTVSLSNGPVVQCSACDRVLDTLIYSLGELTLCARCARRNVR